MNFLLGKKRYRVLKVKIVNEAIVIIEPILFV